jgi:CubicO group peptidase (beta-lactamase class C family)
MDKQLKYFFILSILIISLASCEEAPPTTTPPTVSYWPTEGWHTSSPEQQGIDSAKLVDMIEFVQEREYNVDSIVVIRHGYEVAEIYFEPFSEGERHILYSCTKSVVSALIGIAIEMGYIQGVDQPMLDFFPDYTPENNDERKESMTIEDLLTMSTGFECRDSYLYENRGLVDMHESDDWVQHVLDLPMENEPGTYFEYCNGSSFLLSAIITQVTGMSALEYAQEKLFPPMGITDASWDSSPDGINYGYSHLFLQPEDMAKFGYLYLHSGKWDGEQVVPAEWVEVSTKEQISAETLQDGYGYQWWTDDAGYYMALGYLGQFIFVLPDLDMVVVIVSDRYQGDFEAPEILLTEYIIPGTSVYGSPLPENDKAFKQLQEKIVEVAEP